MLHEAIKLMAEQHIVELNIMRLLYNAILQKNVQHCKKKKSYCILVTQLPFSLLKTVQKKTRKWIQP